MQVVLTVLLSLVVVWASSTGVLPTTGATFLLQHQDAAEVAPILEEVLQSRGTPRCGTPRCDAPAHHEPQPVADQLRAHVDPARNAVFLQGPPGAVREAVVLLRRLDVPGEVIGAR